MANGKRVMGASRIDAQNQASTYAARSSSNKQSQTLSRRNPEGRDRRHQDYHPTPYFPIGPPMPGPWGPPLMMYPPCPPWVGWGGPWAPPPMPFHLGWSGPKHGFGHGGYYAGDDLYGHVGHQQDRKTRQSKMPNQTIWFPRKQQQHLVISRS
jgi:hypothetical protein